MQQTNHKRQKYKVRTTKGYWFRFLVIIEVRWEFLIHVSKGSSYIFIASKLEMSPMSLRNSKFIELN